MRFFIGLLLILRLTAASAELSPDDRLSMIIELNQLAPKECARTQYGEVDPEEKALGEMLFTSKVLSGDEDTSCRTCHLEKFNSTDGLPLAVGVGGEGEGPERLDDGEGVLVQRNALSLVGRGLPEFQTYFWDGKVDTGKHGELISQFGDVLGDEFEEPLSLASTLPLLERDEFIGKSSMMGGGGFREEVDDKLYFQRYLAVSKAVRERLMTDPDADDIRRKLRENGYKLENLELADIGTLLGKFIADEFRCRESKWDSYIAGDTDALSRRQKEGAVLFYSRGRCSNCHEGALHTDFEFHSIGVPQGQFGPHSRHRDLGRAAVTLRQEDLYLFRTPPLNGVAGTAPYGHNGIFDDLDSVVEFHINPIAFFIREENRHLNTLRYGKILDSRDELLTSISLRDEQEVRAIVEFLKAL